MVLPYSPLDKIMMLANEFEYFMSNKMTRTELCAVLSLSSIMSLRMIGLFMVLPVFTLYASQLAGATPTLIGLAMGIYGLAQALLQIPFGAISDRVGRKPIIAVGLLIFSLGSLLCAIAHSIELMMLGRALQGAGAVGGTILAMMADLTREDQRTKSMAIAGITIGASFMIAMLIGPILAGWFGVSGLFYLAATMGILTIALLYLVVPNPTDTHWHADTEPELYSFLQLLVMPQLAKLNSGIFILHAIFTASFVVIPISLQRYAGLAADHQWQLYAPALLIAFVISLACIGMAERKKQVSGYFIGGILVIACAQVILWASATNLILMASGLCLFLAGFSLLEAFLPSLISRAAPRTCKGSAMGIYSCSQFLGIFAGGALGGWLYGQFGFSGVHLFCLFLSLCWLIIASSHTRTENPDFITRKEQLQSK
jgi:MFS family permease